MTVGAQPCRYGGGGAGGGVRVRCAGQGQGRDQTEDETFSTTPEAQPRRKGRKFHFDHGGTQSPDILGPWPGPRPLLWTGILRDGPPTSRPSAGPLADETDGTPPFDNSPGGR